MTIHRDHQDRPVVSGKAAKPGRHGSWRWPAATLDDGELYRSAKKLGFLDTTIAAPVRAEELPANSGSPSYKMVDTCAAEFNAETPYFYSTFDEENEAEQFIAEQNSGKKKVHRVRLRPHPHRPGHRV